MSPKKRLLLILIALALFLVALAALIYACLPARILQDLSPIAPTYFVPPVGTP